MSGISTAWILFSAVAALNAASALLFVFGHARRRTLERGRARAHALVEELVERGRCEASALRFARRAWQQVLRESLALCDAIALTDEEQGRLRALLSAARIDVLLLRDLNSAAPLRRMRAAVYLPLVASAPVRRALVRALEQERSSTVRLRLAVALASLGESGAIPTIVDSLFGQPLAYRQRIHGLLAEFAEEFSRFVPLLAQRKEPEIQLLLIHLASRLRTPELEELLKRSVESVDRDIAHAAFRVLASTYAETLDHRRYLADEDFVIRNIALQSLGGIPTATSLALIFEHLDDPLTRRSAALALQSIVGAHTQHFRTLLLRAGNERRPGAKAALIDELSKHGEYLLQKLVTNEREIVEPILTDIVRLRKSHDVINFLNHNSNREIEDRAIELLRGAFESDPEAALDFKQYLDSRLLDRLALAPVSPPAAPAPQRARPRLPLLYAFLVIGVAAFPVAAIAIAHGAPDFLTRALTAFNSLFAVYAAALNGVYLLLLGFSAWGVARQVRAMPFDTLSVLFKDRFLPSISIISPAFNEEASIVESVNALLSLRYPDFEVIVVNDGSRDHTLEVLIREFELQRTDRYLENYLSTQPIRGIYACKRHPNLLVVDKANGGKADSLNAGINAARKEYFAGIDADSLLERDALLRIASLILNSDREVVAAGGNIMPVNGCTVRRGALVKIGIPPRPLGRFQTVEYLRAFMAGRLGWAQLGSLLIISGAFGVFNRRRVIDAHGYLTRSEHYARDTVGEDMELVVRLAKEMRERELPYAIRYAYNANCWTEIPESTKILDRQRSRWQRGLLEIISYHIAMTGNPRYGTSGLVAFPYYLLFEILGPWFEVEGFFAFIVSIAIGAIGAPLVLVVSTASVLLGTFVTMVSLVLAEAEREYFPFRQKLVLVAFAVLENVGFRQYMSFMRLKGFVQLLAKVGGWGAMERRGLGARPK